MTEASLINILGVEEVLTVYGDYVTNCCVMKKIIFNSLQIATP